MCLLKTRRHSSLHQNYITYILSLTNPIKLQFKGLSLYKCLAFNNNDQVQLNILKRTVNQIQILHKLLTENATYFNISTEIFTNNKVHSFFDLPVNIRKENYIDYC